MDGVNSAVKRKKRIQTAVSSKLRGVFDANVVEQQRKREIGERKRAKREKLARERAAREKEMEEQSELDEEKIPAYLL